MTRGKRPKLSSAGGAKPRQYKRDIQCVAATAGAGSECGDPERLSVPTQCGGYRS
ncbi:hypothetical protein PF003_g18234 [Phytophthora fragariae]|nr:hypothetical protein PF003_g18234 [Phytophthora fragariae]